MNHEQVTDILMRDYLEKVRMLRGKEYQELVDLNDGEESFIALMLMIAESLDNIVIELQKLRKHAGFHLVPSGREGVNSHGSEPDT